MSQTDGEAPDDILLSRYCRQKDLTAFSALIDRHQADLLRTAHALLGDGHAAQDAVQEGFLRLSRDAEALVAKWRAGASLGGWLCTVVRNWCIDHLRRKQAAPMSPLTELQAESAAASATLVADADAGQALWRAVDTLPQLERAAVVMRYRDGLSYQDIAERLDKTATHVGVLLHQALGRLRNCDALRAGVLP
ncbi:MAG: sigma-70 family RNA polymerase sigma factor [Planctomycetes bacterium]|nr:sigma-70 family RNA polymerase sigma factor [Planctomycetota bacterium]